MSGAIRIFEIGLCSLRMWCKFKKKDKEMKVYHLPDGMKSVNDAVNLSGTIEILVDRARSHKSFYESKCKIKNSKCKKCNALDKIAIHHIKPVWVMAAEHVIKTGARPRSISDTEMDKIFPGWNSLGNLEPLCKKCHERVQQITDRRWKITLSKRYRLSFAMRWCNPRKELINESEIAIYVDQYITSENKKLEREIEALCK